MITRNKVVLALFGGVVLVAIAYIFTAAIGGACITEQRAVLHDLGGFDFLMSETDCDLLTKDAAVSIFASKVGGRGKTLLFKYDWARYDDPVPDIKVSSDHRITISIQTVSSISVQNRQWQYGLVDYEIGHVEFPSASRREVGTTEKLPIGDQSRRR